MSTAPASPVNGLAPGDRVREFLGTRRGVVVDLDRDDPASGAREVVVLWDGRSRASRRLALSRENALRKTTTTTD